MTLIVKNSLDLETAPLSKKQEKVEPLAPLLPLTKAEKTAAIKSTTNKLNKDFETLLVQKLGKKTGMRFPSIPTDLPTFDETLLSCGGLPKGRVIEVFGPESAGKTTFALHCIASAQKTGGNAVFVDAEHALDVNYAKKLGVDVDNLIISQPDYGEQALEVVLAFIESRAVDIIVIDSVSALVPKAELEGDMGDVHMGLQARLMSQAMRKIVGRAAKTGTIVLFINQIREKIGVSFGNPEVTSGGRALKFYSSVRLEVRRLSNTDGGQLMDENKIHIGHRMRIKNVKNKVGPPFRETVVDLLYATGLDTRGDMIEYAISLGVIEPEPKGWFAYKGKNYRKNELTADPVYGTIVLDAMSVRDNRLKADAAAAEAS